MRAITAIALVLLAAIAVHAAPAEPPAAASAPMKLRPVPARVENRCRLLRGRVASQFPCPIRLPRATIPPRPGMPLPPLHAERSIYRDLGGTVYKLDIGYGAPYERNTTQRRWRHRPCCFLHFEILRRPNRAVAVPSGARPAVLAGRHGLFKPAYGYGIACPGDRFLYWCNHVAFLWRERGQSWVATLHYFGPKETRALRARLVASLRFG